VVADRNVSRVELESLLSSRQLPSSGETAQVAARARSKLETATAPFDGNGNVVGLINSADGSIAACYEYSPFGEFLRCQVNDSVVQDQPFRFSTKFYDAETGLYNFGLRYYAPSQGRFLGRDPSSEQGGLNLYAFCLNDALNHWDHLGMEPMDTSNPLVWQYQEAWNYALGATGGKTNTWQFTQALQQWYADYYDPNGGSAATSAAANDFANGATIYLGLGDTSLLGTASGTYTFNQRPTTSTGAGNLQVVNPDGSTTVISGTAVSFGPSLDLSGLSLSVSGSGGGLGLLGAGMAGNAPGMPTQPYHPDIGLVVGKRTVTTYYDDHYELRQGGSRSWRNNNPGNVRMSNLMKANGAIGAAGGFAVFPDYQTGMNALSALLQSNTYRNLTIGSFLQVYAPPNENDTARYTNFLQTQTGLAGDAVIGQLGSADFLKVLGAIQQFEGWIPGDLTVAPYP
jgi:RHS repeat-associated protein